MARSRLACTVLIHYLHETIPPPWIRCMAWFRQSSHDSGGRTTPISLAALRPHTWRRVSTPAAAGSETGIRRG